MYDNGQRIDADSHFQDHMDHEVPIQILIDQEHADIGFIEKYCPNFIVVNNTFYKRSSFTFISRPGY